MSPVQAKEFSQLGQAVFQRIEDLECLVIAAVNGYALGGGCELSMCCDIRIAGNRAKFGQPEVKLGVIPGFGGTQRLAGHLGKGNAMYLIASGKQITADEALSMGLVQAVTEQEELMDKTLELAAKIIGGGPEAIRKVKFVVRKSPPDIGPEGFEIESQQFGSLFDGEGAEGMKAFLEKRKPLW